MNEAVAIVLDVLGVAGLAAAWWFRSAYSSQLKKLEDSHQGTVDQLVAGYKGEVESRLAGHKALLATELAEHRAALEELRLEQKSELEKDLEGHKSALASASASRLEEQRSALQMAAEEHKHELAQSAVRLQQEFDPAHSLHWEKVRDLLAKLGVQTQAVWAALASRPEGIIELQRTHQALAKAIANIDNVSFRYAPYVSAETTYAIRAFSGVVGSYADVLLQEAKSMIDVKGGSSVREDDLALEEEVVRGVQKLEAVLRKLARTAAVAPRDA